MPKRNIIKIDAAKCNGYGQCIPNCPEGAIQIIDGKARLVSDLFCDGLGACIGHCPQGAITIEARDAGQYDERKVMENIVCQGKNVVAAHLEHLKGHNQKEYLEVAQEFLKEAPSLSNWPVQLMLVPAFAPYLNNADILIAADCVPFAYADFHQDILKGKVLLVGCPKLDDIKVYQEKITQILKNNQIQSITYAHMEVPCCFGLVHIIQRAISEAGKDVPFKEAVIGIKGERR